MEQMARNVTMKEIWIIVPNTAHLFVSRKCSAYEMCNSCSLELVWRRLSIFATIFRRESLETNECSQIRRTLIPDAFKIRVVRLSRCRFLSILALQNRERVFGT